MSAAVQEDSGAGDARIDPALVERVAELADRIAAGEAVDLEAIAASDPAQTPELRRLLNAMALMAELGASRDRDRAREPFVPTAVGQPLPVPERLGDFELIRLIGRGGMGLVYEARQLSIERKVAVKVLPPASAADPRQLHRFLIEAQAVGSLNHPHIVPIYSIDFDRGAHFFAMRYVDGESLAQVLRRLRRTAQTVSAARAVAAADDAPTRPRLTESDDQEERSAADTANSGEASFLGDEHVRWAARLTIQAAAALQHAHGQGVIHRDVKPANLLLDRAGALSVSDFGLARLQGEAGMTRTGDRLGTLRYMSPEQAHGGVLDGRADIYALGMTLYELLTLKPPFEGYNEEALARRIIQEDPRPPRKLNPLIPVDLETIVTKAIAKEPSERYATAGELAEDLRRFLAHRPILARRPSAIDRLAKWTRRHRKWAAAAASLVVLVILGLTTGLVLISREQARAAAARDDAQESLAEAEFQRVRAERAARRSQRSEAYAQELLHVSDMKLAARALARGDPRQARALLDRHRPRAETERNPDFVWSYINARLNFSHEILAAGIGPSYCLEGSPDGRLLAAAGKDARIRLFDLGAGGRPVLTFETDQVEINGLSFSSDGRRLASAGDDGSLKVWDLQDRGQLIRSIDNAHEGLAWGVRFVADDTRLLSDGQRVPEGNACRLWNAATGARIWSIEHPGSVEALAIHPDGSEFLLLDGEARAVRWVDLPTGEMTRTLPVPDKPLVAAYAPDGRFAVIGGYAGFLGIVSNEAEGLRLVPNGIADQIEALAFLPDGSRLLVGDRAGVIHSWAFDPARGRFGPSEPSSSVDAASKPAEQEPSRRNWLAHEGRVYALSVEAGGGSLISTGADGRIPRWNLDPRHSNRSIAPLTDSMAWIIESGRVLELVDRADRFELIDRLTGDRLCQLRAAWLRPRPNSPEVNPAVEESLRSLAMSRDGRFGLLGTERRLMVFDGRTGTERFQWVEPRQPSILMLPTFSPDGRRLAVISGLTKRDESGRHFPSVTNRGDRDSFNVRLIDLNDHQAGLTIPAPRAQVLAFAPDGRTIAIAAGNHIQVRDVKTGARRRALAAHETSVTSLRYTSDGRRLVSVGNDRRLIVWDPRAGTRVASTIAHHGPVSALDLSPDDRLVATLGRDNRLKLWHLPTLQHMLEFPVDSDWALAQVRFTADRRGLAVLGASTIELFLTEPITPAVARLRTRAAHSRHEQVGVTTTRGKPSGAPRR